MPVTASILGLGAVQAGVGIFDLAKSDQINNTNPRPTLTTPPEYVANQKLAQSQAQFGIDPTAEQALKTQAEQGLTATLGTVEATGGTPNTVSDVFMNYIDTLGKNAVADSQLKDKKIQDLYTANNTLGDFGVTKFLYNEDGTFKDKAQRANALSETGLQDLFGGLDTFSTALSGGTDKQANAEQLKQLLALLTG